MYDLLLYGVPVIAENVTAYNTVAASMFSFYDYMLTFKDEVKLIWRAKLTWVSILFYAIRYLTFLIRIVHLVFCTNVFGQRLIPVSISGCHLWVWFQVLSGQLLFVIVEILLITRVFAFYERRKILLAALLVLLAGEIAAVGIVVATTVPSALILPSPLPPNFHGGACVTVTMPSRFSSLWVPPLVMQSVLFGLVAIKFLKARMDTQTDSPPLLVVFVRDDAWAFLTIFAVSLWATLAYELTAHQGEIALTWHYSALGFCGSRLILNLRSAGQAGTGVYTTQNAMSDLKFRTNPGNRMSRGTLSSKEDTWTMERSNPEGKLV